MMMMMFHNDDVGDDNDDNVFLIHIDGHNIGLYLEIFPKVQIVKII